MINLNPTVIVIDDTTLQAQSVPSGSTYQWLDCNDSFAPIPGETGATFTTQNSGDYAVNVSYNICSATSSCFTINTLSAIDAFNTKDRIQIYPNPTLNNFTISLEGIDIVDIVIINIYGKVLLQKSAVCDHEQINLSSYVSGIYFVKIITPDGIKEIRITKQ